jgi:hypothetical protein
VKKLFGKNNGENGEASAEQEVGGISLTRMSLLVTIATVGAVLLSGALAYFQFVSAIESRQQDRQQTEAQRMAAYLSGRMLALGEEASRLAIPDLPLLEALAENDREALSEFEAQLMARFPEALQIRYILPVDRRPESGDSLGIGYASLDLARIAEGGQKPPVEIHRTSTDLQHIALVRPVQIRDQTVASLILMLDPVLLQRWLSELGMVNGLLELYQGEEIKIFSNANMVQGNNDTFKHAIEGSSWILHYKPASTMDMDTARQLGFIAIFLVIALILAVLLGMHSLYVSRFVREDMRNMVTFIVDSSLGKRFHSYPVRLAESKKVLQEKEADLAVLSSNANVMNSVKDKHTDHDIPDMLFGDDDGIVVVEEDDNNSSNKR